MVVRLKKQSFSFAVNVCAPAGIGPAFLRRRLASTFQIAVIQYRQGSFVAFSDSQLAFGNIIQ